MASTAQKPTTSGLKIKLVSDTGSSATDSLTSNGALLVTGAASGDLIFYRMSADNGKTWSAWTATATGAIASPANDATWLVQVQERASNGKVKATTSTTFTLDTHVAAPLVALANDTSAAGDGITSSGALTLSGLESGATAQYSVNGGLTWSAGFAAHEGANTVSVRQIDLAGNVSAAATLAFTLDTTGPQTVADSASTSQDTAVTVAVLANDSDANGVSLQGAGAAANGSVVVNADGTLTYTPNAGFTGADSFQYTVADAAGNTALATVSVSVDAVVPPPTGNTAPNVSSPITVWTPPAQPVTVDALQYAWDAEGNPLSVVGLPATLPAGVSYDAASHSFSFDPGAYAGPATVQLSYGVSDGQLTTSTTVTFVSSPSPFVALDPVAVASPAALTDALLAANPGIVIDPSSIAWHASGASSSNLYDGSLAALGIGKGLLLTSGTTPAPLNTVGWFGTDNNDWAANPSGANGDADLDAVVNTVFNTASYDATSLSFSFTVTDPNATSISFDLVFGSDEFPEWVDQFVDCAIVLVNGQNVALFNHDPLHPLSVIGSNLAGNYFIDNTDGHLPIEYDGVSATLKIVAPVHAGTNTIKIAIGDTGDHIYDSGIFLANFQAGNLPGDGVLIEQHSTTGGAGDDLIDLSGYTTPCVADGGAGDDVILGGSANDTITGGLGKDHLQGNGGNDVFDYRTMGNWADQDRDTVMDFSANTATLANAASLAGLNGDVLLVSWSLLSTRPNFTGTGFSSPDAGHYSTLSADWLSDHTDGTADAGHAQFVYNAATGLVSFDPDGTGSESAIAVTLLGTLPAQLLVTDVAVVG